MNGDWKRLARENRFVVDGAAMRVSCGNERWQMVTVDDSDPDTLVLSSVIVKRGDAPPDVAPLIWKMNRFRELVGFKIAEYGRVVGECRVPRAGLSANEWKLYVLTLARACDRLEYLWTGRDAE